MKRVRRKDMAKRLDCVILSEAKNLVPNVYSLGLYNVKSICSCEILRFAQNDSP
jgi:hypothetical protein